MYISNHISKSKFKQIVEQQQKTFEYWVKKLSVVSHFRLLIAFGFPLLSFWYRMC